MEEIKVLRINLRKEIVKKARWKRKKLLMKRLKEKLIRILKSENVKIGNKVNEYVHAHSVKNLPYKLTLKITKKDDKYFVDLA